MAGPLGAIPPYPLLALAPRAALWVGRRAVVEDPAIGRPRPAPLELSAGDARRVGLLARGQVSIRRGEHAAVDPGGAGGGPVVLEIAESGEVPIRLRSVVAIDILEDLHRVWFAALPLVGIVRVVLPDQSLEALVARQRGGRVELLEPPGELMGEPQIGTAVARRIRCLEVPLDHALGIGEAALVLRDLGGGEKEDFLPDVLTPQLPLRDLRTVLPEGCGLGEPVVLDDQPLELGETLALHAGVERGRWVLADAEEPLHASLVHGHEHRQVRMVPDDLRVPVIPEVVVRGGRGP